MEPTESRRRSAPLGPIAALVWPLWRGVLLVLIAFGGAGLAVAVDRPQNSAQRPELSWRADQQAVPWIERLSAPLAQLDSDTSALSDVAQDVLTSITSLDLDAVETALRTGDDATARLEAAAAELSADRDAALAALEEWRLGDHTRGALVSLGVAADSLQQVPDHWQSLANQARLVVGLIRDLREHDDLVFQATAAGRESRWGEALGALADASARLDSAGSMRNEIAAQGDVTTLDDLLARYAEYDAALADLYTYIRDTGSLSGPDFDAREQRVEQAQAALPRENAVMTIIGAETAAQVITQGLVGIERARGAILDAQEAVLSSPEPTTEPELTTEPEFTTGPEPSPGQPGVTAEPSLPPA
jgi:hypothetical protein